MILGYTHYQRFCRYILHSLLSLTVYILVITRFIKFVFNLVEFMQNKSSIEDACSNWIVNKQINGQMDGRIQSNYYYRGSEALVNS